MLQNKRKESGFPRPVLWQIRTFLYSDGGSQGHFSGWQGHPPRPEVSSSLSWLQAHQLPVLDLPPAYLPHWPHGNISQWPALPSPEETLEGSHCPGRNPKLGLELQAPPAPSLPVPLGLTHICTHTCIPPTVTHTHHPHSHAYTQQYMHIYSHTHVHTYLSTSTHVLTPPHTLTYSYRCTHMHSFPPYH